MVPVFAVMALVAARFGRLAHRYGSGRLMIFGYPYATCRPVWAGLGEYAPVHDKAWQHSNESIPKYYRLLGGLFRKDQTEHWKADVVWWLATCVDNRRSCRRVGKACASTTQSAMLRLLV
jgi:hypothetical protein